jgi:nucleotide-binding universal stress UspA family protein
MSRQTRTPEHTLSAATAADVPSPFADGLEGRTLLLAVDASPAGDAAARVASALAAGRGAAPHAVRALELSPYAVPAPLPAAIRIADELLGEEIHAEDAAEVRAELRRVLGREPEWPVHVGVGTPARLVLREAARLNAGLVVMGLRRHNVVDRALGDETTLQVMRAAHCPVLGVTPELSGLPRRALVGIDFGRASVRAARAAIDILPPGATLVLAYVEPASPPEAGPGTEGERVVHALGIAAAFQHLIADLGPAPGIVFERAVVEVAPGQGIARRLLAFAESARADLIAVGSQQHERLERWLLGSVTTELARAGQHSLLVVPPHRPDASDAPGARARAGGDP